MRRKSLFSRLADWFLLCPTRDPIDPEGRRCERIQSAHLEFELWGQRWEATPIDSHDSQLPCEEFVILKFPGTGGRAERAGSHPAECWPGTAAEVWAVNPPGYGSSPGSAHVADLPEVVRASWRFIENRLGSRPILISGNSLGCCSALYLASFAPVSGLLLRNPPPVHQLIAERWRYNWWNGGAARWVAREFPAEMDVLANAARCHAPALFVRSGADRLVPVNFQQKIFEAYSGPKRVVEISGSGHHDPIPESAWPAYFEALEWLRSSAGLSRAASS